MKFADSWPFVRTARDLTLLLAGICAATGAFAADTLTPSLPSGQPVGRTVIWSVGTGDPGAFDYRLSVGRDGGTPRVVYDYGAKSAFEWTPIDDGAYQVVASLRHRGDGSVTELAQQFLVLPRAFTEPVITPTDHPLVALYSAPPCPPGRYMRVHFSTRFPRKYAATDLKACDGLHSMNFYLAGMMANRTYAVQHEERDLLGLSRSTGPVLAHATGSLPPGLANLTPVPPIGAGVSATEGVILVSPIIFPGDLRPQVPLATDLAGRVLWYYDRDPDSRPQVWRPLPGGTLLANFDLDGTVWQGLREIDLAGHVVRETTAARVSEQLVAMGRDPITSIHHEAIRLPDGRTAILGSMERIYDSVQGETGPVDVMGDAVIVLDENWQVVWAWSGYDHLDVDRAATLGGQCGTLSSNNAGCPPIVLVDGVTTLANDWMHANSIGYSEADGNLIVSLRHQDWVIKIDYQDGAGSGALLWRLGPDGDFTLANGGGDAFPWFSHQHDANYFADGRVVVYDNGNVPCDLEITPCQSRGQAYRLDEGTLTATRLLSAGLDTYAYALGSAQALANGNGHFHSGLEGPPPVPVSRITEVSPLGVTVYAADLDAASYRSFRLVSMYSGTVGVQTLPALAAGAPAPR